MQTFKTIQEAFKNGTGDVFFTKDGNFVARSRHIDNLNDKMAKEGFTFLSYDEVVNLSLTDNSVESAKIWATAKKQQTKCVRQYDNCSNGRDGYYDEFPDAYGQSL